MKLILVTFLLVLVDSSIVRTTPIREEADNIFLERYTLSSVPNIVEADGYPLENYYVTTGDGYILNVHRIPFGRSGKKNNKVAYLQHGILASSSDWILNGPGKALAYILADEGYDVWMGNVRGNKYSRNHSVFDPDTDSRFWQFSWHDIGVVDVPTIIDFVLEKTGADGVYYAGHSQGTTVFYVMTSMKPEYNSKIKAQVSLAPIAYMSHLTSPLLRIVAFWEKPAAFLLDLIGMDEFLPSHGFMAMLSSKVCTEGIGSLLCGNVLFALCGFSPEQMNTTEIPVIMANTPAGSSTKQILHYGQGISSGKFRQYDFGAVANNKKYGSIWPPAYDLGKITAPTYLIYSKNDWLAAIKDVEQLYGELGGPKAKFLVTDYMFNHLDFTFGIDAPKLIYSKVVSLFSRH
ncbi:unnamed protein product [Phaedon cochleariae]|uniref:Lipase n=1 Tax=Phaedon cochleariae TaxID=80249 RepID=A0A9P0DGW6_PHACE|nr:unnamed protein product [Phaedon cochleariae]